MLPDIRYTEGDPQIAYQVLGDGDLDLVFAFDWASNVELIWQHPSVERFLRRLASYSRLVVFDTCGMGQGGRARDARAGHRGRGLGPLLGEHRADRWTKRSIA